MMLDGFPGVDVVKWMNGIRAWPVMRGMLLSVSCPARMDWITLTVPFQRLFSTAAAHVGTSGHAGKPFTMWARNEGTWSNCSCI